METPVAMMPTARVLPVARQPSADLLRVRDLTVCFSGEGGDCIAVDSVSLDISPGEIVGLLGESGCGKSTIALSLLRLLPPSARVTCNSVFFCGRDLCSLNESQLRKIRGAEMAIIYQDSSVLNPVIRVGEQVSEVLRAHHSCTPREARHEVERVFAAIGLLESDRIYNAYPHQLSGGQLQRIAIAQALICKPRLVIADEPTASVDAETARAVLAFMKEMRESCGTAFLFISHDPATLATIAHRVAVMYAGKIVESGPLREIYSQPAHPYTDALLRCAPQRIAPNASGQDRPRLPCIPGQPPDHPESLPGCSFSSRCLHRREICDLQKPEQIEISTCRSVRCLNFGVS
jgi:oligopeptide/dipeptide ABC transporter ATP-binding protein